MIDEGSDPVDTRKGGPYHWAAAMSAMIVVGYALYGAMAYHGSGWWVVVIPVAILSSYLIKIDV